MLFSRSVGDEDAIAAKEDVATTLVSRPLRHVFMWRIQNHKHSIVTLLEAKQPFCGKLEPRGSLTREQKLERLPAKSRMPGPSLP